MFSNLNFWEIAGLVLLGLFIFGPERLPKVISDGVRMVRNLRDMARNATADLSRELGTDVRLEDLHPRTFIRKHLLSEDEERQLRRPFDDVLREVRGPLDDAMRDVRGIAADANDIASGRPRTGSRSATPDDPTGDESYGAESYGPDTYGPDTYGPDTYGPDTYGPDTYGPDKGGADKGGADTYGPDKGGADKGGSGRGGVGNDEQGAGRDVAGIGHSYDQVRPYPRQSRPYQPDGADAGRYDSDAT